jgi:uncharacterized protein
VSDNKERIRHMFAELSTGNSRPLVELLADDVAWTVMGHTQWSGTYRGKQTVLKDLLGQLLARLEGRYRASAHRIFADGDYVIAEARAQATTKNGAPYDQEYCFVYRFENGAIKEVTEYMDTELVTKALGAEPFASDRVE